MKLFDEILIDHLIYTYVQLNMKYNNISKSEEIKSKICGKGLLLFRHIIKQQNVRMHDQN